MPGQNIHDAALRISKALKPEPSAEEPKAGPTEEPEAETSTEEPKTEERFKVKVGEQEFEVTLEELRMGYMRGSDYQQKTTKAKQLREQYESQTKEFSDALAEAKQLLDMELEELESNSELRENDPEEYLRLLDSVKKKTEKFKKLKEKEQKAKESKKAEKLKAEQEKLREAIPEWLDSDKQQSEVTRAVELLSRTGYSEDELGTLSDHRLLVLARKAALYDEIVSSDLKKKEVKEPPKVSKPSSSMPAREKSSAAEQFRANPSKKLLAAVIKDIRSGKRYR